MKSSWRDQDMWPLQSWMKSWREQHMATTGMKSWTEQNMWPQQSWGPCTDNKIQKQTPHFSLFVSTFSSFSQSNVTHTQWCHPQTEWQLPHPHTECCHPYTECCHPYTQRVKQFFLTSSHLLFFVCQIYNQRCNPKMYLSTISSTTEW